MEALACPHCSRLFFATPAILGKRIRCRGCRNIFGVPRNAAADPKPAEKPLSAVPREKSGAPLPIAVESVVNGVDVRSCPSCGHVFAMKDRWVGATIRCRVCQGVYSLAASTAGGGPAAVAAARRGSQGQKGAELPATVQPPLAAAEPVEKPADHEHRWGAAAEAHGIDAPRDAGEVVADTEGGAKVPFAVESSPGFVYEKTASALASVIAIILGGITALPVTQLILWWGLGRDPLNMAVRLPASLQWAVPESLRKP